MLFWGLRGLGRVHLFEVEQPQVVLEVAGRRVESEVLANYHENPNFTELVQHLTVVRRGLGTRIAGQRHEGGQWWVLSSWLSLLTHGSASSLSRAR